MGFSPARSLVAVLGALAVAVSPLIASPAATGASIAVRAAAPAPAPVDDGRPEAWGNEKIPVTELVGQYDHLPALPVGKLNLSITNFGFRYRASYDNNKLVITPTTRGIKFADAAANGWQKLPKACKRVRAPRGVAADCKIPKKFRKGRMFLEIWPKLGNDSVDGSALPAKFRVWALTDEGNDTLIGGAGQDFLNSAQNQDKVYGGSESDWIRIGDGANTVFAGPGNDKLSGGDGADQLHGGSGSDSLGGMGGNDALFGDEDADRLDGGPGSDKCKRDGEDRFISCDRLF